MLACDASVMELCDWSKIVACLFVQTHRVPSSCSSPLCFNTSVFRCVEQRNLTDVEKAWRRIERMGHLRFVHPSETLITL